MLNFYETDRLDAASDYEDFYEDEFDEDEFDEYEFDAYDAYDEDSLDFLDDEIDEAINARDLGRIMRQTRPQPRLRPPRPPITLPPITITVRPAFVLDRFAFNRTDISPAHRARITAAARAIVASWSTPRPIRTIRLVGHTDSRGAAAYNIGLGQRRARAVEREFKLAIGRLRPTLVRRIRFVPQSLGESRPVASNATPLGQARNRRVQVFYVR
jgi:outer membrane protein OmpA-like peptidoglycan-associated protein